MRSRSRHAPGARGRRRERFARSECVARATADEPGIGTQPSGDARARDVSGRRLRSHARYGRASAVRQVDGSCL
jgi:hypothetical protein